MNLGGIQKALSRHLFLLAGVCAFVFLGAPKARATSTDPLQLDCGTTGLSACQSGPVGALVETGLPTFQLVENGSVPGSSTSTTTLNAYLLVVVPTGSAVNFSVSVNGGAGISPTLVGTLNASAPNLFGTGNPIANGYTVSGTDNVPTFSFFQTTSGQAITPPSGFDVYSVSLGSFSCAAGATCTIPDLTISISGTPLPSGTTFFAYLTDSSATCSNGIAPCIAADTDQSETATVVPEPATLGLIGSGLLLLGLAIRRREVGKS